MHPAYYLSVTIHVLAAMTWLGGMFFFALVGAPALRRIEPPSLRQQLFTDLGTRFRSVGWLAIAVLVLTGLLNLHYRGLLHWSGALGEPAFWRTGFGHALGVKLFAVAVMLVVSFVHDMRLGPAAGQAMPGSPAALALRQRAALLARMNAALGVVVVAAAVRLARA